MIMTLSVLKAWLSAQYGAIDKARYWLVSKESETCLLWWMLTHLHTNASI